MVEDINMIANIIKIVKPTHRKEVIALKDSEMGGTSEGSNTKESIKRATGKGV